MKKAIIISLVIFIVFLIYISNVSKKTYYVSIGDYLSYGIDNFENNDIGYSDIIKNKYSKNLDNYVNYSTIDDYRVMDLINDINYNKKIIYENKEYKLQHLLIKANLMTISIGMNDLIYKKNLDYDYVDQLLEDIEKLLKLIRKYNKDEIYFLSFYNTIDNFELIEYTNKRLSNICDKNKIKFIDISNLTNYIKVGNYPTKQGYKYISDKILNFTKQ